MFPIIIFTLITQLFAPHQVFAITPTPTKTATPSSSATSSAQTIPEENISDDIQKIRDAVKQKVQEKLKTITQDPPSSSANAKKAILGTIIQIDKNNLTIDYKNNTRKLSFAVDTVVINSKQTKVKSDSLKVGQDILAMGYINNDVLEAKRIVFMDIKTVENQDQVVVGTIVDISKSSPILVLIPTKNKNSQYQIKTDSKTEIINKTNQKIDLKNIVAGQKVIAIVSPDPKIAKTYIATKIISIQNPSPTPVKSQN